MDQEQQIASDRPALNRAGIKEHALRCSKKYRAGKFTRVSEDVLLEIEADVEAFIRELRGKYKTLHEPLGQRGYEAVPCPSSEEATWEQTPSFVKGALMEKIQLELDKAIARLIQNKVQKQPSCGCTVQRTY